MIHGSNRKNSYYSRMYLNGDFDGLQIQTAYDSRVVHNASTASIDYSSLAVDDPLFADMPWPTESGTAESKAFANHIQWKRKLSDGERLRWHRWAIYQRIGKESRFEYSAQDYIFQNMMAQLRSRSSEARLPSPLESHRTPAKDLQDSVYHTLQLGFAASERDEVTAVMRAYYSAFNRKNFDELRYLWLPAENSELTLPGFDKVRGGGAINKLYYQLEKEVKPLGTVQASISRVQCFGCVSLVHTVETVLPDSGALRTVKKKGSPAEDGQAASSKQLPKRRVLATTTLRKFNKQWRIVCHHAQRIGSSPYTGDQVVSSSGDRKSPKGRPQQGRLGASVLRGNEIKATARSDIFGSNKEEPVRGALFKRSDSDDKVFAVEVLKGNSLVGGDSKGGIKGRSSVVDGMAIDYQLGDARPSKQSKGSINAAPDTKKGAAVIDDSAATCKQTVQALRLLQRVGIISDEMKQFLISDIVENLVYDKISLTETAFEMLYMYPRKGRPQQQLRDDALQTASLKDFADQCAIIAAKLSATSPYASVYGELSSSSININKKKKMQQQQLRNKFQSAADADRSITFSDDSMDRWAKDSEADISTIDDDDMAVDEEVIVAIDDLKGSPGMDVDYDDQNDD